MLKTGEGKWVLFAVTNGEQAEFWPIDAKAMLAAGSHTTEPPTGIEPKVPVAPPKNVAPPKTAVVETFVKEDGTAEPAKKPPKKAE